MNTSLIPEDIHPHILNQAGSNLSMIQYCKIHSLTYHRMPAIVLVCPKGTPME